jgi:hypothetical protein
LGIQGIKDTLPTGAAQDVSVANATLSKDTGIGNAQAGLVQQAPSVLAQLGTQQGAFSLQNLGAALSGYGVASGSNQATGQLQTAQSQALWAPILGLAGVAGNAAGGALSGALSQGGALTQAGGKG